MKLATYKANDLAAPALGIIRHDWIIPTGFFGTMIDLISRWDEEKPSLTSLAKSDQGQPLNSVILMAPVLRPGKIFAIGLNYADHIAESKMDVPAHQVWFTKAQTSINGPYDNILIPKVSAFVDYEVELVAIIGTRAKNISKEDAHRYIFGYCVGNDVTERFWQHRTPQWTLGKSFDTHAPIGPWITTSDELADPHDLTISCQVNDQLRQHSSTRQLVFNIFEQVEHLSQAMTLEPGDLIFTGTPGGVGAAMDPRQFLKPGDVVTCTIEKLGSIKNLLAAEV